MKDIIKLIIASIFLISVTIVGAWALSLEFGVGILSIIPPILAFFSLEAGLYKIFMSSDTKGGNANETSDINDTISGENEAKSRPDNSGKTSDKIESEENDRPVNKTAEPIIEDGSTIQKNKDLLKDAIEEVGTWYTIYEDGDITITEDAPVDVYSEMLLYVIAARHASETSCRSTALVSGDELMTELGRGKSEVAAFLFKCGSFLESSYYWDVNDFHHLDERDFQVNIKKLPEATEWLTSEEMEPLYHQNLYFGEAQMCISNAIEYIEEMDGTYTQEDKYDNATFELLDAFQDVFDYPLAVGDTEEWKDFVRYIDQSVSYLQSRNEQSAHHCIQRIENILNIMSENI